MIWFLTNKDEEKIWEALKNNAYIVKIDQSDEPGGKSVIYLSNGDTIEVMNGKDGDTGASITVESVSESTEDGGVSVVTFSDGNKLSIKNGSKGAPGPQGPQGKDYVLTDVDKAEIAAAAADLVDVPATPKDYGAIGLGTTDDTEAFRQALAENRTVHVPGGRYVLSDTLVVRANCCLELSQDTVLEFVNEEKNAITLLRAAHLKGNHATITVPYTFSANVIHCDTGEDEAALDFDRTLTGTAYKTAIGNANNTAVPPFVKWDPQWKMTRYVTDVNICKPDDRGFHYSKDGDCFGTAIYLHCDAADYVSYMWGVSMSGVRIAGGFAYGIRAHNIGDAWNHDMRIEALIDACKVGVSMENCHYARLAVTVQPRRAYSDAEVYKAYAENGILLKDCRGIDLSGSRVWDWNAETTLWAEGNYYQHIALLGECRGLILDDFLYHEQPSIDIRRLIYTDTPSNLENMTILQEPIDRWFKTKNGEAYFHDGYRDRKLVSQEEMDAHFGTDFVKGFTDVLASAEDTDGTILNGVGYKIGARLHESGTVTESPYYGYTGFIPCAKGSTIYAQDLTFDVGDQFCKVIFYDADKNLVRHINRSNIVGGSQYYAAYRSTEGGFALTVNSISDNNDVAYARFTFYKTAFGENPMMAVDEEIQYTVEGYLADNVKVKAKNVIGLPDGGSGAQSDWSAAEGEPGHVLSRTHYEDADGTVHKLDNKFIDAEWMATMVAEGEEEEILPERTISFTSKAAMVAGDSYKLLEGSRYTVYWNGTAYACTAALASSGDMVLGNGYYHMTTMQNTGEPFCFTESGGSGWVKKSTSTAENIQVQIVKLPDIVPDKLPEKFLPDGVVKSVNGTAPDENGNVTIEAGGANVLYTPQTLTDEQKAQARKNIGAASEGYVLTETDKDEIKEAVKEEVPLIKTPEHPTFVNSVEECTDPEKIYVLPDGYMYAHGTKYVKQYTNVLPTFTDADGNIYNGCGYKPKTILSYSTGEESDNAYCWVTGFIPLTTSDIVRIRNLGTTIDSNDIIIFYDADKKKLADRNGAQTIFSIDSETGDVLIDGGWIPQKIPAIAESVAYIRLSIRLATTTMPDFSTMIFTRNEEITEGEVEGFYSTGLVYQPMDNEDRIIELEKEVAELKKTGGGGNVSFDYSAYGLPELALTGDVSAMTKENAVTLDYVYGDKSGTCTCKWQGSSSLSYTKKNYTIKFDNAFEAVEGWGEQKKYCFKANYIDHTHARNIVSAKLWGAVVRSRSPENDTLEALPNCGAIDGFPCVITINGKYQGLYTFNIPKDGWMFGMGSGTNEAILCAGNSSAATCFKGEAVVNTDFDLEYVTNEDNADWVTTSLNRLINACINSDGTDLDTTIAQYLDWESAIDYCIFTTLLGGTDMTAKNYLLVTYDGTKWFFSAYDMDSTYGLYWNGKSFINADSYDFAWYAARHKVVELIKNYKKDALKARYAQLRKGALSEANVLNTFSNFVCKIPERIYLSDTEVWPLIPSSAASNLAQIVNWYQTRAKIIDAQMEAL